MEKKLNEEEKKRLAELVEEENQSPKYAWSDDFQTNILGMLLSDKYFLIQSIDKISPNYFSKESHVLIVKLLYDYFEKYKTLPEKWFLKQEIVDRLKDLPEEQRISHLSELEKALEFYKPGVDAREALEEKVSFFAKVQSLKITFHKCIERMQKAPEDNSTWTYIYDQMRQTMLIDKNYEPGLEYFLNIEEMFERMKRATEGVDSFTSGFPEIDRALNGGGLMIGNIAAWIALPGTGKSLAMCKAAVENVLRGKRVLYITMEMDELGISQRFTSQWAKCDINNLLGSKNSIIDKVKEFSKSKLDPNMLVIKQFPGGTMDVNGIRAYHSQLLMRGFKPDLLIVDYVGEMKDDPSIPKYESAYRILRDLRAFGIEQKHCTITCVQPNSTASRLEQTQYIDESNIGTSFDQYKPLDCFWSINQTPIEKDASVARMYVIKHRNGKSKFAFHISFDYELGSLDMWEVSAETYRQKMNLVNKNKSDKVMENDDSITEDSNSGPKKKRRGRLEYQPADIDSENIDRLT